jgi:hypothetical protein
MLLRFDIGDCGKSRCLIANKTVLSAIQGIPFAIKDPDDVKGYVTTYRSWEFRDNVVDTESLQVTYAIEALQFQCSSPVSHSSLCLSAERIAFWLHTNCVGRKILQLQRGCVFLMEVSRQELVVPGDIL